jgi:hypothetical protein
MGRYRHQQHRALDARGIGGLANVERDLIRTRTAEGTSRAKAQGSHMGPQCAGRYAEGIGAQLQRRDIHHPPRHAFGLTPYSTAGRRGVAANVIR